MRTVYPSKEIPHLWANQSIPEGHCSSSMSFNGPDFYSYGTVIGHVTTAKNGQRVYLISDGNYSVTTSGHQSRMQNAIPSGAIRFIVPGVNRGDYGFGRHTRIISAWKERVIRLVNDAATSRQPKKGRLLAEAQQIATNIREFCAVIGEKPGRMPVIPATAEELAKYTANQAKRDKAAERKRKADEERKLQEQREAFKPHLDGWLQGYDESVYALRVFPTELRIKGDMVETSRGASFPVSHARRGLAIVRVVMARGEEWVSNGYTCHLGHYRIDRITPDGTVYAGCHVVPWTAIERIAPELDAVSNSAQETAEIA